MQDPYELPDKALSGMRMMAEAFSAANESMMAVALLLDESPRGLEEWNNFLDNASVGLHCVDSTGKVLWVNCTELKFLGYDPDDYVGVFIGDFHVDTPVINDILQRLTTGKTLNAYPARLRAEDGTIKHVLINSNVYQQDGKFCHTRCFTTGVSKEVWQTLRDEDDELPPI